MAPLARPASVGPSAAAPKPLARISTADLRPAPVRVQPSLTAEPISPGARGSVIARAAPADAVAAVDAVVKQQVQHDSLLKSGTASAWEALDKILSAPDAAPPLKAIASATSQITQLPTALKDALSTLSSSVSAVPATTPALDSLHSLLASSALFNGTFTESEVVAIVSAAAAVIAVATITAATSAGSFPDTASDAELPSEYDGDAIYRYWTRRPSTMLARSIETATLAAGFLVGLQMDRITGKVKENEKKRARALREAVDRLGPAYIKVAQALSTRVDLLSPAYYEEITLLQDQVKPFPNDEAMEILEQELGQPAMSVFSSISAQPVAAASLGQVYRATLRSTGADVAVKVQRPGVLELVALDLVIGRKGVEIAGALFPNLSRADDFLPVLDEWAYKLYRELDYRREASVMERFQEDMRELQGIMIPQAFAEATTRRVLTTEWVEGEKLSESAAGDVRQLCTTLLNAYLIQLLESGLLHADPHPGNLIRTPDGRICILDFGLVTEVPQQFRVYILEYMAHLSLKDWQGVGQDFVNLEFVAPGSVHPNAVPGLMDSVGILLEVLMGGGGAKNLDKLQNKELVDMVGLDPADLDDAGFMDGFASVLSNLADPSSLEGADSKDRERAQKIRMLNEQVKFRLPPYFVLILRAFSVIEGIALKVDPDYSIITETFPFLSRKLLTDDNEQVRRALREVLYGGKERMDMERFRTLFDSLQSFSTDGLTAGGPAGGAAAPVLAAGEESGGLDKNTLLALQSIFDTKGTSYIQELLVAELAATLESLSRSAAVTLLQRALQSSVTTGTLGLLNGLGPLRRVLFPLPLPAEVIARFGDVVKLTEEDELAIRNVEIAWGALQPQLEAQSGGAGALQMSLLRSFASSVQELPGETRQELVAGASRTSALVLEQLMQRTASRFSADVAAVRRQAGAMESIMGGGTQGEGSLRPVGTGGSAATAAAANAAQE
eukprot:jgi/Ulvmu1/5953/UM026_0075.1